MAELGSNIGTRKTRCSIALVYTSSACVSYISWARRATGTKHLHIDYVKDVIDRRRTRRAGNNRGLVATIILDGYVPVGGRVVDHGVLGNAVQREEAIHQSAEKREGATQLMEGNLGFHSL